MKSIFSRSSLTLLEGAAGGMASQVEDSARHEQTRTVENSLTAVPIM